MDRDRAVAAIEKNPSNRPLDVTAAIIFSVTAVEAFINELQDTILDVAKINPDLKMRDPKVYACGSALDVIEAQKRSVFLKLSTAAFWLSGQPLDKGVNPYQDSVSLATLRNRLVHFRPLDNADAKTVADRFPGFIRSLQQRGLAHKPEPKKVFSAFSSIRSKEMAAWSYDTAHAMIMEIVERMPPKYKQFNDRFRIPVMLGEELPVLNA
jgi:hypothetical protein